MQTLLLVVAGLFATTGHADRSLKADAVLVYKSERLLMLLRAGEIIGHFPIALGKNPVGPKTHEGDARTPEGRYYLDWRNPDSRFLPVDPHFVSQSPRPGPRAPCRRTTRRHGDDPWSAERSEPGTNRLG
jgi:L,D-peptidoglycan transpeptidase YkuD (ErfK/YbiS/YcfS/YnhG family)